VDVLEIEPGLWRWTAWHEEWKEQVGSVSVEGDSGVALIDPLVPPEDSSRFWQALDRDVETARGSLDVLVTVFWHTRSAGEIVRRYGGQVWAPRSGAKPIERRSEAEPVRYRPGDRLPCGIEAIPTARSNEVVFWLPDHETLVPGDVILGAEGGGLRLCPRAWLPESRSLDDLRASLRPLLQLPVRRVLVSHGDPVLEEGAAALARALS
jgi:glyoxylase-like metal-dependent hydrolase (beta-lactamase superfamily II)